MQWCWKTCPITRSLLGSRQSSSAGQLKKRSNFRRSASGRRLTSMEFRMTKSEKSGRQPCPRLLDYFDRIYVINLPARTDRKRVMDEQLPRIDPSFQHPRVSLFAAIRPQEPGGFDSI